MNEIFDAEDFLEVVYGDRDGWIDLPAKVGNYWVPFYTEWPNDGGVTRRIDSSLRDREDLYYSVAQFAERGRAIQHVLPSPWLWADLDEVHPTEGARLGLQPTIAIESSPGRYQALWRLTRELKPKSLERVNRGLSYALGADRGGWDLTQVLRIPGTRNFKYPDGPVVRVLHYSPELEYDPKYVWSVVKEHVPSSELRSVLGQVLPRKRISARAKSLLRTATDGVVEGERSSRLWELECLLAESGLSEDEIYDLVSVSVWHKWRGQHSGEQRLRADIRKALTHVRRRKLVDDGELEKGRSPRVQHRDADGSDAVRNRTVPEAESDEGADDGDNGGEPDRSEVLPFVGYSSFMAMVMEEPRWLIENLWVNGSHGIIGGEPKTQKTTLALAIAMAVASGENFLGLEDYPVGDQGPVLMVQEENAPWMMQDRMRKIANLMGLLGEGDAHVRKAPVGALGTTSVEIDFPRDVPLRILNNYGFDLAVEEHREMLEAEVEAIQPKLLILDPLYLILGTANENTGAELRPFLKWLLQLRYKYNCAVAVIHHMRKQQQSGPVVRAGQRLMGNATLHGWVDSAVYTSALEASLGDGNGGREGEVRTRLETEFRSMAPQRPIDLSVRMDLPGGLGMSVSLEKYDLLRVIRNIVSLEGAGGVTAVQLADQLGVDKRTVLSRVRGADPSLGFVVEEGGKGRGKTHRITVGGAGSTNRSAGADDE